MLRRKDSCNSYTMTLTGLIGIIHPARVHLKCLSQINYGYDYIAIITRNTAKLRITNQGYKRIEM